MRFAFRLDQIGGHASKAWEIHSLATEKRARGEFVILLTVGTPISLAPPRPLPRCMTPSPLGGPITVPVRVAVQFARRLGDATLAEPASRSMLIK